MACGSGNLVAFFFAHLLQNLACCWPIGRRLGGRRGKFNKPRPRNCCFLYFPVFPQPQQRRIFLLEWLFIHVFHCMAQGIACFEFAIAARLECAPSPYLRAQQSEGDNVNSVGAAVCLGAGVEDHEQRVVFGNLLA